MAANLGEALLTSIRETDLITWAATISAVVYVFLALKENVWCWLFGIIGSGLSIGVYFYQDLWYESMLSVFYVILGVYGWLQWAKEKKNNAPAVSVLQGEPAPDPKPAVVIGRIPSRELFYSCAIAVVCGIVMGYISSHKTESHFAYMDALLTAFSVIATWMTAKKYIENWIFWIVIDAASAVLYYYKGPSMYLFALLFIFYTFMAAAGYLAWKKSLKA